MDVRTVTVKRIVRGRYIDIENFWHVGERRGYPNLREEEG